MLSNQFDISSAADMGQRSGILSLRHSVIEML